LRPNGTKAIRAQVSTHLSTIADSIGSGLGGETEVRANPRLPRRGVLILNYKGGEQTITIPPSATVVSFDKVPADQLVVGRKVFIVMKKDGSEAAAVVIGAEGVKPPM
jgi:hypothetical protein